MDIQEIQEKFEDLLLANPDFDESLLGKDEEGCYLDSDIQHMYSMFEAGTEVREQWQAAKAQADQKVKLLLCDEHLKKCESPTGIFNSQYPDEEPCLICLAKEAKAQAVPEGFVLMPKEIDSFDSPIANALEKGIVRDWPTSEIYAAMIEAQEPTND